MRKMKEQKCKIGSSKTYDFYVLIFRMKELAY